MKRPLHSLIGALLVLPSQILNPRIFRLGMTFRF